MTDYIKRAFDFVRAECRNVRTTEEGLADVLDVLDAAERSALGAGAKPETRTKSAQTRRGSIEACIEAGGNLVIATTHTPTNRIRVDRTDIPDLQEVLARVIPDPCANEVSPVTYPPPTGASTSFEAARSAYDKSTGLGWPDPAGAMQHSPIGAYVDLEDGTFAAVNEQPTGDAIEVKLYSGRILRASLVRGRPGVWRVPDEIGAANAHADPFAQMTPAALLHAYAENGQRLGFASAYSDALSEFNAAAREAHRLQQEIKAGAADYAAAVAAISEIAAADPMTSDDTGALTPEAWLRFRDVARAARAKQTEAQAASQRYAAAVQKLSEAAVAAEPSR